MKTPPAHHWSNFICAVEWKALHRAGVEFEPDVLAAMTDDELMAVARIGRRRLHHIREWLWAHTQAEKRGRHDNG